MALTHCPSCNKKISDKAPACPHCQFAIGSASKDEVQRKVGLNKYKKKQSIQNQSLVAMLLFIAGFGFMYWGGTQPGDIQHNAALTACVVGFVWYVVNRVRLVFIKRS